MGDVRVLAGAGYTSPRDDPEAIERAALLLWVEEFGPDDHRTRAAARRRWDGTTEGVRESWRRKVRRIVDALEGRDWAAAPREQRP